MSKLLITGTDTSAVQVPFKRIEVGEVFEAGGDLCIKTEGEEAILLMDGYYVIMLDDELVTIVDAKLTYTKVVK